MNRQCRSGLPIQDGLREAASLPGLADSGTSRSTASPHGYTNHKLGKIDGTYNLYDYDDEKQMALEALERKLVSIVSGAESKVIPISAGKKAA